MKTFSDILCIVLATTACVHAAAVPDTPHVGDIIGNLVITEVDATEFGPLVFYSDASTPFTGEDDAPLLTKRQCGSNRVAACNGGSNRAGSVICQRLIGDLRATNRQVAQSPRAVCLGQSSGSSRCCTSWSQAVANQNFRTGNLAPAAEAILNQCRAQDGLVSGRTVTNGASLQGVCATQCLSNRPDGCN